MIPSAIHNSKPISCCEIPAEENFMNTAITSIANLIQEVHLIHSGICSLPFSGLYRHDPDTVTLFIFAEQC
jgi:hypothetical protein